jgi:hypothetical protein
MASTCVGTWGIHRRLASRVVIAIPFVFCVDTVDFNLKRCHGFNLKRGHPFVA